MEMSSTINKGIAGKPPKYIRKQTIAQMIKAETAVRNQPPITDKTPVMRNTALSRPQARSASEEPIATINVTYVVDKGSLRLVPIIISIPANTRLTAARTISKDAPSSISISSLLKRLSIHFIVLLGTMLSIELPVLCVRRTMERAAREEPNISSPSSWRARSTLVLTTFCAFFEVVIAIIIMIPAVTRKNTGVLAESISDDIIKES